MKSYFDIQGDGGSDVLGQVVGIRKAIAGRLSSVDRCVAIGSGKGGVGKSTLTMQLAQMLRERGKTVSILDADINGPSQARMAGLLDAPLVPGPEGLTIPSNEAGIGVLSLGTMVPEGQAVDFDSVSSGETFTWRATREFAALGELLCAVNWGKLDYLLLDLPPGAERTLQYAEYFGVGTPFILVTVPSDVARGVVGRSVDALRKTGNPILGCIENMAGFWCADCGEVKPLFPTRGTYDLGIPSLGSVPFDPRLAEACDRGLGFAGNEGGAAVKALRSVTDNILMKLETLPKEQP